MLGDVVYGKKWRKKCVCKSKLFDSGNYLTRIDIQSVQDGLGTFQRAIVPLFLVPGIFAHHSYGA